MDDEYCGDYYEKPRLRLASVSSTAEEEENVPQGSRTLLIVTSAAGVALLSAAYFTSGFVFFLLVWLAAALLIGPHAPLRFTGGDCRVGVGWELPPAAESQQENTETDNVAAVNRTKSRTRQNLGERKKDSDQDASSERNVEVTKASSSSQAEEIGKNSKLKNRTTALASASATSSVNDSNAAPSKDWWTLEQLEQLRKLLIKHPKGTLGRWDVVAEAIGGGKTKDDVIRGSKILATQKPSDADAYTNFLQNRKPAAHSGVNLPSEISLRQEEADADDDDDDDDGQANGQDAPDPFEWTEAQDRALMQALKEFPKETPMRWERVAAALTGKNKQECFRRFCALRDKLRRKEGKGEPPGGM